MFRQPKHGLLGLPAPTDGSARRAGGVDAMAADKSASDLIGRFGAASSDDGDAHWRSDLVRKIADHPDKTVARAILETLLREFGFEGAKAHFSAFSLPSLNWRRVAWKELLNGLCEDEEAFAFAEDIASRHRSRFHRIEAVFVIRDFLVSHPGAPAVLYRHITDPENADEWQRAIGDLAAAARHTDRASAVRTHLMQIAGSENPRIACCAAGHLLMDHSENPDVRHRVETLLRQHPLGFEESVYDALSMQYPPSSGALKIWLGILDAAQVAPKTPRMRLELVAHGFWTDKAFREALLRVAQLAPSHHLRATAIGALALHFTTDRRTLALLVNRLSDDPSGMARGRAFVWLIAMYSRNEKALSALVNQLSKESDAEALREMLKACLGGGRTRMPQAWSVHWADKGRSCDLALREFPLSLFGRPDLQALLKREASEGTKSFILNFLRPKLTSLREHLGCYPLMYIDYDRSTRARWRRIMDEVDALMATSHTVDSLYKRFREADDLDDIDCDRERKMLIRQIAEHSDTGAARSVLGGLLLEGPDEEDSFRDRSNAWRNDAWALLFQNLWSEEEGVAFADGIISGDTEFARKHEALRQLADGCTTESVVIENLSRYVDHPKLGESATQMILHRFPAAPASYALLIGKMARDDYYQEHPIETLEKHFPDREETRQAIETEIRRSPLRKSARFYNSYARIHPKDGRMKMTLATAVEAVLSHADEGHRSAKPGALPTFMEHFGNDPEASDLALRAARTCESRGNAVTREGLTWLALIFHDMPQTLDLLQERLLHDRDGQTRARAFAGLLGRYYRHEGVAPMLLDRVFEDGSADVRSTLRDILAGQGYEPTRRIFEFGRMQFIRLVNDDPDLLDRVRGHLKSAGTHEYQAWARSLFGL